MTRSRAALLAILFLVPLCTVSAELSPYVRVALGHERSDDTVVRDLDCSSTQPPALFGCVAGSDGRVLAARGDFGEGLAVQAGAGLEVTPRARVELTYARRDGLALDAHADFLGVAGRQPVDADAESASLMAGFAYDLAPQSLRVRPFVAASAGMARNEIGRVTYAFPSLGAEAVTIVQGGRETSFAWSAATGLVLDVTDALLLELAVRYSDLGEFRTDAGEATIIRPNRTLTLDIAGTRAPVVTIGAEVALRWRL